MIDKNKDISLGGGVPIIWVHLLLLMMFFFTSKGLVFADFAGGSGTVADPFQISTIEQLQAIKDAPNTSQFILINDIDASATAGWNGGQGFIPVGWFGGGLDGQGYTISDLTINRPGVLETALFTHIGSVVVLKNFHLDNVNINGGNRTGAVAGTVAGLIENVNVSGIIQGTGTVGGVAGQVDSNGSIIGCHADVSVTGSSHMVGGLLGNNNGGTLEDNSSEGSVSGENRVGGLVGSNAGPLSNSHSSSTVNGEVNVGGLVGFNHNTTIEACYSTGSVTGNENVGGLAGFAGWIDSMIRLSFSTADVEGTNNQVGGLIGRLQSGTVENSYARGDVEGNNRVGGLVGEILFGAIINNSFSAGPVTGSGGQTGGLIGRDQGSSTYDSFWDEEVSGQTSSEGGTGKTTAEMLTQPTFANAGWDFTNIWSMDAAINDGYPYLIPNPPGGGVPGIYYSRTNGVWSSADTWSTDGHTGPPAIRPPIPPDQVIIGNNHQVTLTDDVTNNQSVTVNATGTLATGQYVVKGNGNFFLEAGGTLQIGSADGISESGGSGSIKSAIRSFSNQANYVYDGTLPQITGNGLPAMVNNLTINNSNDVEALGDLVVNGQLILTNGTLIMPPGKSLVTYSVTGSGQVKMQQEITGSKGWRMVSSPVNTTHEDLFNGFVSQGFTGSTFPDLQPNILWFEEIVLGTTNMGWQKPNNITDTVTGGRGHFQYVFNGAGLPDNSGFYDDTLPVTMNATGQEYMTGSSFNFNITHTERPEDNIIDTIDIPSMNTGWNLVGNPTTASLDWEADTGWIRTNMDETFYVWVAGANDGEGGFMAWNSSITDIEDPDFVPDIGNDGLIAPFQAFWVRANAPDPVFSMTHDVKTTGAVFEQQSGNTTYNSPLQETLPLALKLQADGLKAHAYITFSEKGKKGEDPWDAYQLEPMEDTWLKLFTTTSENQLPMVINNLPFDFDDMILIPVYIDGVRNKEAISGTYSLKWSIPSWWPANLKLTLMDHENKKSIPMQSGTSGKQFEVIRKRQTQSATEQGQNLLSLPSQVVTGNFKQTESASGNLASGNTSSGISFTPSATQLTDIPRFSIVITSGEYPDGYIALTPELLPPYPNPASRNSETTIRFSLPETDHVTIRVLDLHGRQVQTIANRSFNTGFHYLSWFPGSLNHGIYFVVLQSNNTQRVEKLILGR